MLSRPAPTLLLLFAAFTLAVAIGCGGGGDGEDLTEVLFSEYVLPTAAAPTPESTVTAAGYKQYVEAPNLVIFRTTKYDAIIQMENGGKIVVELWFNTRTSPFSLVGSLIQMVNNFAFLALDGFYDGTTFHKVVPGDYVLGGDPTGTGAGGPGYTLDNFFSHDYRHDQEGTLAFINTGIKDVHGTNGSQFFITLRPIPEFDGLQPDAKKKDCGPGKTCYPAFGRVVQGMDVVRGIQEGDVIKTIAIIERPEPAAE